MAQVNQPVPLLEVIGVDELLHIAEYESSEGAIAIPARSPDGRVMLLQAVYLIPEHRAAIPVLCIAQ